MSGSLISTSSSSHNEGSSEKSDSGDFFYNADFHHVHFALKPEDVGIVMKRLEGRCLFKEEEELFHDTFWFFGKTDSGRELWLRRRRNLSTKSDMTWMLSETWEGSLGGLLRLKEVHGMDAINARLALLKVSQELSKLPVAANFRFFRRNGLSHEFGTVNIDETMHGITLSAKIENRSQFDNVIANCKGYNYAQSKLKIVIACPPVSEHLCGYRSDMLVCDMSEDEDEDDEMEWRIRVAEEKKKQFVPPPVDARFSDHPDSEIAKRRAFFAH
jgi:hypothetical protein